VILGALPALEYPVRRETERSHTFPSKSVG
jgi:hypothetical protein